MIADVHRHHCTGVHTDVCACTHTGMLTVQYGRAVQVGSHTKQRVCIHFCIENTILYDLRGVHVTQNQVLYALFVYKLQFCVTSFLYSACVHTVCAAMCEQGYAPVHTMHLCIRVHTHVRPLVHSACATSRCNWCTQQ